MKNNVDKAKHFITGGGRKFKKEFRRQARILILFTLGFTIAFTWRETIFDLSQSFIQLFTETSSTSTLSIMTSTFITLVSIILIYITSYYLRDSYENY